MSAPTTSSNGSSRADTGSLITTRVVFYPRPNAYKIQSSHLANALFDCVEVVNPPQPWCTFSKEGGLFDKSWSTLGQLLYNYIFPTPYYSLDLVLSELLKSKQFLNSTKCISRRQNIQKLYARVDEMRVRSVDKINKSNHVSLHST